MKKVFTLLILLLFLCQSAEAKEKAVIHSVVSEEKYVSVTFDDGPHPTKTAEILDILKEYNVKATFFVVGENAERYSSLIEREYNEGHEIGNHTFTHANLRRMKYQAILNEIKETEDVIYEITETRPKLLRPPGGNYNDDVLTVSDSEDYDIICWSIDTRDWAHTPSDSISETVLSQVKNGDIILFHDFIAKNSPTPEALRKIIPALQEEGYTFVTVSELLAIKEKTE